MDQVSQDLQKVFQYQWSCAHNTLFYFVPLCLVQMAQIFAELLFGMKPWVPISTKAIEPVQISGKAAIGYIAGL